MRFCKCGRQLSDDCVFCPNCGAKQNTGSSTSGNNWFSPADNLDDTPVGERSYAPHTEDAVAATSSIIKPVKGAKVTSSVKEHTAARPVPYGDAEKTKIITPSKPVNPVELIGKCQPSETAEPVGSATARAWGKYAIAAIAVIAVIIIIFAAGGSNNKQPSYGGDQIESSEKDGNYFTVEQARQIIGEEGYKLGDEIEVKSEDGDFYYKVNLAVEEFNYLTLSGYIEFTAKYDGVKWITNIESKADYEWKISGDWFADTEGYDVYIQIKSYTGTKMRLVLEAQYDSTSGGKGSYDEHDQIVTLQSANDTYGRDYSIYEAYLYCKVSGGYPVFNLRIDKDSMTIWETFDSYKAEFVPN